MATIRATRPVRTLFIVLSIASAAIAARTVRPFWPSSPPHRRRLRHLILPIDSLLPPNPDRERAVVQAGFPIFQAQKEGAIVLHLKRRRRKRDMRWSRVHVGEQMCARTDIEGLIVANLADQASFSYAEG